MQIEALLNNDIIGSDISGDGRSANNHLRVFSEGPGGFAFARRWRGTPRRSPSGTCPR